MQQHGRKYFAHKSPPSIPPPPQTLGMGSIGQNSTFSEYGHVAYQIKLNHKCSNMSAPIYPPPPPPPTLLLGIGSVGQNSAFSEHGHVECQIKGKHEMQQHSSKYFVCSPSLPHPWDRVNRSKFDFFRIWSCCISN